MDEAGPIMTASAQAELVRSLLHSGNDIERAANILKSAQARFVDDPELMILSAQLSDRMGDQLAAEKAWTRACVTHPDYGPVWLARASAYRCSGQTALAADILASTARRLPNYPWVWAEWLELALVAEDAALAYCIWRDMRPYLVDSHKHLLRMLSIRVLWLQQEREAITALLRTILDEDPREDGEHPMLWYFARELWARDAAGWANPQFVTLIKQSVSELLVEPRPMGSLHAVMFRLPVAPLALLSDALDIVLCDKTQRLGALREIDPERGCELIAALTHLVALAPNTLKPAPLLSLMRVALAENPEGFSTLVRQWRHSRIRSDMNDSTAEGAIDTLCWRVRLDEDIPTPALLNKHRRLKIALCVSGQMRGFTQAQMSLSRLCLDNHDVTTVVHTWRALGRRQPDAPGFIKGRLLPADLEPAYQLAWNELGRVRFYSNYPQLCALFASEANVDEGQIRSTYNTEHVIIDDDAIPPFNGYTNQEKMFFKISAAQDYADRLGGFDLVIRIRPDKEVLASSPIDWWEVVDASKRRRLVYNDSGAHHVIAGLGMGDQFAFGETDLMREYASVWGERHLPRAYGTPPKINAHTTLLYHLYARGIRVEVLKGVSGGRLFDVESITRTRISQALKADIGGGARHQADLAFLTALKSSPA